MCGCAFSFRPGPAAARSVIRTKAAVVNRDPHADEDVALSRCSWRSVRRRLRGTPTHLIHKPYRVLGYDE
jgi:hypothetical protein